MTAAGLSNLGEGVLMVSAPLLAASLTTSDFAVTTVTAAYFLPWLVLSLPVGAWLDVTDRRRAWIIALISRTVVLSAAALVAAAGHLSIPIILAVALAFGCGEVVADAAASSMVPDVVPRDRLVRANTLVQSVAQLCNYFLGAPIAGVLVAAGAAWALGAPAVLAVACIVVIVLGIASRPGVGPGSRPLPRREPARDRIREGLRFVRAHPTLRYLTPANGIDNFARSGYAALLVLWAVGPSSVLGLQQAGFGLVYTALGAGALAGAAAAPLVLHRWSHLLLLRLICVLAGVVDVAVVLVGRPAPSFALLAVSGAVMSLGGVLTSTTVQRVTPPDVLGRVVTIRRMVIFGAMPFGAVAAGLLAEVTSTSAAMVLLTAVSAVLQIGLLVRTRLLVHKEPRVRDEAASSA